MRSYVCLKNKNEHSSADTLLDTASLSESSNVQVFQTPMLEKISSLGPQSSNNLPLLIDNIIMTNTHSENLNMQPESKNIQTTSVQATSFHDSVTPTYLLTVSENNLLFSDFTFKETTPVVQTQNKEKTKSRQNTHSKTTATFLSLGTDFTGHNKDNIEVNAFATTTQSRNDKIETETLPERNDFPIIEKGRVTQNVGEHTVETSGNDQHYKHKTDTKPTLNMVETPFSSDGQTTQITMKHPSASKAGRPEWTSKKQNALEDTGIWKTHSDLIPSQISSVDKTIASLKTSTESTSGLLGYNKNKDVISSSENTPASTMGTESPLNTTLVGVSQDSHVTDLTDIVSKGSSSKFEVTNEQIIDQVGHSDTEEIESTETVSTKSVDDKLDEQSPFGVIVVKKNEVTTEEEHNFLTTGSTGDTSTDFATVHFTTVPALPGETTNEPVRDAATSITSNKETYEETSTEYNAIQYQSSPETDIFISEARTEVVTVVIEGPLETMGIDIKEISSDTPVAATNLASTSVTENEANPEPTTTPTSQETPFTPSTVTEYNTTRFQRIRKPNVIPTNGEP